ncbi:MAG TPA: dihydrolipoamide acetyltransferase family protein [Actinomycetota bacterium]|jgi:pyruvate dehydrogenase E2 component (dihydrolipoamide acetyltransferase)
MSVREFLLPDLGEGLEDAEVVAWRVAEGEQVELNQILVEVNTAKALVEVPAPWAGVVERRHATEGEMVKVGAPLVSIRVEEPAEGGVASTSAAQENAEPIAVDEPTPVDESTPVDGSAPKRRPVLVGYGVEEEEAPASPAMGRRPNTDQSRAERRGPVAASPPVRRLAKELGIDLAAVTGTGSGGRVTREDVMNAADEANESAQGADVVSLRPNAGAGGDDAERVPVKGTRRLIAEKMSRSVREIPHVTTFLTVDATHVQAFREELSKDAGEKITALPIVVRALVETCKRHPLLNASFDADRSEIVVHHRYHVGIATDTEQGLIVPVVTDADRRGIVKTAREIARLTEAARRGKAKPNELVGSTITVTNVGSFGAEYGTPIINHPESAILALGVIEPRPLVVDGRLEPRAATTLSLSFDHRVLDGAEAGRALRTLGDILESPFRLGALAR